MLYEVGQVVYLLISEEMKIVPVQVVEQVVRKRYHEDTSTSYIVMLPGKNGSTVNLSDIEASVHTSVHELRAFMVENATSSIDRLIEKTIQTEKLYFASQPPGRETSTRVE